MEYILVLVCGILLFHFSPALAVLKNTTSDNEELHMIPDGGRIELNCRSNIFNDSTIQWNVFGKIIGEPVSSSKGETFENFNVSRNGSLIVTNPTSSFTKGLVNIACKSINNATNTTMEKLYQVVFHKAPRFTNSKIIYDVQDDGSTESSLACTADGFPKPDVRWIWNSNILEVGSTTSVNTTRIPFTNLTVSSNGSLQVISPQRQDGFGLHVSCFASNTEGNATERFLIRFLKAPKILTPSFDIKLQEKAVDPVKKIPCQTTGYPKPLITWKFGEVALNASGGTLMGTTVGTIGKTITSSYEVFENGTLSINNPVYQEHVPYRNFTCVASSFLGEDRKLHKFSLGPLTTYSFEILLSNSSEYGEVSNVIAKIERVFQGHLSLRSMNVSYVNITSGRVDLDLTWYDEDLEDQNFVNSGRETDTALIATKVRDRLILGGIDLDRFLMNAAPGPVTNLVLTDATKTSLSISWKPPEYFEVTKYQLQVNDGKSWKNRPDVIAGSQNSHVTDNLESGTKYLIRLVSENGFGAGDIPSKILQGETDDDGLSSDQKIIIAVVVILVVLAIIAIILGTVYRRKMRKEPDDIVVLGGLNPYERSIPGVSKSNIYVRDGKTFCANELGNIAGDNEEMDYFSWLEISRESLIMGDTLGQGEFGLVVKALWMKEGVSAPIPVAVKTIKDSATETDRKELFKELRLMAEISKHPNVVNLIGACANGGPLWMVVELCENGNLLSFLRKNRKKSSENSVDFVSDLDSLVRVRIAYDVSKGMHYLEDKKIVHRDLAARNILLGENKIAKIADFGLSRDIYEVGLYQKNTGGKLPVKWMAIESLKEATYTSKSDAILPENMTETQRTYAKVIGFTLEWSFGILVWEIETAGIVPYPGIGGRDLLGFLLNGFRLERPSETPFEIYEIMKKCWEPMPDVRPHFAEIEKELEEYLEQRSDYLPVIFGEETADDEAAYINYVMDVEEEDSTPTTTL